MDWLLNQSTPVPTTGPASRVLAPAPVMPLDTPLGKDLDRRPGTLTLSDGKKISGDITTTPDQPVRIWDDAKQEYRDVPFDLIQSMNAVVLWERDEKEWKFVQNGSDVKEYSGRSYPARETTYEVTLVNGQRITGGIAAPFYVTTPTVQKLFVLHKRDKGDVGQTLPDLVYVKEMIFAHDSTPATEPANAPATR